jgi:outer membrane protein assembly factor BamB
MLARAFFLWWCGGSVLLMAQSRPIPSEDPDPVLRWGGSSSPNMVGAATHLPADPGAVKPLWEIKLGTHQYSIPTIDRGRMYLALNDAGLDRPGVKPTGGGLVLCIDQNTGQLVWQMPVPRFFDGIKPPYHFDQWSCGTCSGPVVDGDWVFVIGNRAEVLCLDRLGQANGNDGPFRDELEYMGATDAGAHLELTDGDIVWRYDFLSELGINGHDVCGSTLLVHGDWLYACTSNGLDDRHDKIPKPLVPTLVVLDKKSGKLVAHDGEKIGQRMFHCNWSSPSAAKVEGRTLIFFGGGDGVLYAFEEPRKGSDSAQVQILRKVWSYDCNPPGYRTRDGQPVRYSSSSKNTPEGPSEVIGTPVFHQGRVYVAIGQSSVHGVGQGCLSCVDAATGRKVWSSQLVDRTLATASVADGLLYIPDYTGNLHCFNAETGERYWVHPLESKVWAASTLVADGKVYAGTDANVLWVLQVGKDRKILSKTRLKAVPTTLTAVEGVLYVPTQRSLMAIPGTSN